jgi:uncharacterized membrane protein
MGAWPDWWPANPVGSAYDNYQKQKEAWNFAAYALCALVALLLIIYAYKKVKG